MFFNSKAIGFILSCIISVSTFILLRIVLHIQPDTSLIAASFTFIFSSILFYVALEIFVFKEINNIQLLLEKIRKHEYDVKLKKETRLIGDHANPLLKVKREIAEFAERKQMEIDELKKLETFRREFLADVSHELKTPIFAAQGFVHTLIDGAMNDIEVRDKFLNKAAYSLDGLNVLVEDLITISQLEIGEIKMNYQNFDISKVTQDIFEQVEDSAKNRGVKLKFYKYSPKACYVFADKQRISQVLTNLIVNAIKYGKEKGTVQASFVVEEEAVFISIKDDGPGIEEKHLNRIFERFYRIEKSRSKDKGGTGLGLAIVKHILEAHESKIFVSSKKGSGTIFSFKLKKGKVINEKG